MMFGATAMDSEGNRAPYTATSEICVKGEEIHISGIRPVKPDKQILIPTYPRKGKKNEGDFKDLLETEIKRWNHRSRPKHSDSTNWGFVSLYLGKTKEKVSIKNNTVFLFYKK